MEEEQLKKIIGEITKVINKKKLTKEEIVEIYIGLGFSIGCSIEGIEKVPDIQELEQKHYSDPSLGNGLILQSLLLKEWLK